MSLSFCRIRSILITSILIYFIFPGKSISQGLLPDTVTMIFIGDIMGHDDQLLAAEDTITNAYNFDDVFTCVKPIVSEAGFAIANLEVTLAGPPYRGYPQFSSPDELAAACRDAGIDCFVTANNHVADRGPQGILNTINKLDSLNISHTGSFINSHSRDSLYPLTLDYNGISVAVLNYTYGINGKEVPGPVSVNILDKELITEDVLKSESTSPDITILFLHWGNEYDTIPAPEQIELADYFFSIGVDVVIGSHPHVLQKMMWRRNPSSGRDEIAVYSLGNFVSNQRRPKTDGGAMVRIAFARSGDRYRVSEAGYYLTWVHMPIEAQRKKYIILPCSEFENRPDYFENPDDYDHLLRFIHDSRELLSKQNININEYIYNGEEWVLNN
jgi:hypothetical protein